MVCQVIDTTDLLGKKWTLLILQELYHNGPHSFNVLKHRLKISSNKILAQRLQRLKQQVIVRRDIIKENPLAVQYSLTEGGKELVELFNKTKEWGIKHKIAQQDCVGKNCNDCTHFDAERPCKNRNLFFISSLL